MSEEENKHEQDFGTRHVSPPVRQFLVDELVKGGIRWTIVAFMALVAYVLTPLGERVISIWNSPIVLEQILFELAAQRRVVDWSPATRMQSDCVRGEECVLIARFRRVQSAADCEIIPSATRFTFMSYRDFTPRIARVTNANGRNIGTDFETAEIRLVTPSAVPTGDGELRVSSSYENCAWQDGDEPPTSQVSPAIKVKFVD